MLASAAGFVLAGLALGEDADPHWTLGVDDAAGPRTVATLSQVSVDAIPDEYAAAEVQPELQFRCSADGELTFRIDWQRYVSSFNTEVGFRVDGGGATWLKLGVDSTNRLTIARPADAATLIDRLSGGEVLNVEVAPYSEPSVFVDFNVSTFGAALESLRAACD